MDIQALVKLVAERLREADAFAGLPVIEIDKGNIDRETETKLAQQSVAAVVGWNGFKSEADSSSTIYGEAQIVVSIFETPFLNRANPGAPTLLDLARAAANALHLFTTDDGGQSPLVFTEITPVAAVSEGQEGVVTCDVKFRCKATL